MSTVYKIASDYYAENDIRYVFVDGHICKDIEICYETLQRQLSIPHYFGRNLDALEEVLADLEWVREKIIKIIVLNTAALLVNDAVKKRAFLDILNTCENDRLEIIYLTGSDL